MGYHTGGWPHRLPRGENYVAFRFSSALAFQPPIGDRGAGRSGACRGYEASTLAFQACHGVVAGTLGYLVADTKPPRWRFKAVVDVETTGLNSRGYEASALAFQAPPADAPDRVES